MVTFASFSEAGDFARDVRPILSDKCFKCHGPDAEARAAELRLDRRADAEYVLDADGEFLRRIQSTDPEERMPPPAAKLPLDAEEIEVLKAWISTGAPYDQHWAYRTVERPALPTVSQADWARNEIDLFVLHRLEQHQLVTAPPVDRERFIRRVTFDLTGLPPSLGEIDDFLRDQRPNADGRLVDRLLARPAFGERMLSEWLDVARYSDSYGYQVDRDREVWPWRDWVLQALNADMPYDQFVTQQLAGDLIHPKSRDATLATTFNRLHPQKVEGGSVPEEFRVEYVADRNHTFATAFLGLTLECARCHDHKYDPISQRDYYRLFAFFNGIDEAGLYSYFTSSVPTPTLLLPDATREKEIEDAEAKVKDAESALRQLEESQQAAFDSWLNEIPAEATIAGLVEKLTFEDFKSGANQSVPGKIGKAVQLTGDDGVTLKTGNFGRHQSFTVAAWVYPAERYERSVVFHRSRAWTDAGSRGYQLLIEEGQLSASLIHFWPGNAIRIKTVDELPVQTWTHVAMTYDGTSRAAGLRLFVNGKLAAVTVVRDNLYKNITGGGGDTITIGERFRDKGFAGSRVDEFEVYERQLSPLEVAQLHDGKTLSTLLTTARSGALSDDERETLYRYYLYTADADYREQLKAVSEAHAQRNQFVDHTAEIMVMGEGPQERHTFVLNRGAYDGRGEQVQPGTPETFPPFPEHAPRNRLGLAQWLVDSSNPLTSRVAANRIWKMMLGRGLVTTPEDFGSQGSPPTHPGLLDWLASEYQTSGWNTKALVRQIVLSATYRQSAESSEAMRKADPTNRWLGRANVYRLSAEMIRDNALAASGLLSRRMGGRPSRPYELSASFKPVSQDKGEGLYRRSVYTFWKRTAPAPAMMALDAAKRDVCMVKRERTSSPLQAFVLLNGPQFVEAARVMATQAFEAHPGELNAAMIEIFRKLTSRQPTDAERHIVQRLFQQQKQHFQDHPENAKQLVEVGDSAAPTENHPEIAALTVVASTLMNFDSCVMKR